MTTAGHRWQGSSPLRVLVTGSRGKSSVVRMLHAAMQACGLNSYARLTGVVPRELGPQGERAILRSSAAHVGEMRWWLKNLPASAQGVVLENSAISAEFQGLAGRWLRPQLTVLTNTLPDHQEAWGPSAACAAEVLTAGIPKGGAVLLPAALKTDRQLLVLLGRRGCAVEIAEPATAGGEFYRAVNQGLALAAATRLGLDMATAAGAVRDLPPDRYDFRVDRHGGAEMAMAFSVNDFLSTRELFRSLCWAESETRVFYNHRADRPGRLRSFVSWLSQGGWREVLIIGDRPRIRIEAARYKNVDNGESLLRLLSPGDRVFGCGNIAGLPLSLTAAMR